MRYFDVIQVVNSQRFSRKTDAHPFQVYRALRSVNPSPYMYYLHLDDFDIIGAAIEIHQTLGPSLLERACKTCLCRELQLPPL